MSTRSSIALKKEDGTVESIYCHSDGYPSHVGYMLQEYYNTEEKIKRLISLGDLSFLDKHIEPQEEYAKCRYSFKTNDDVKHSYETPHEDVLVAYHRDRGEELVIHEYESEEDWLDYWLLSYMYIFKNGEWYCDGEPLKEVLKDEEN